MRKSIFVFLSCPELSMPRRWAEIGRRYSAASEFSVGGVLDIEDLDGLVDD